MIAYVVVGVTMLCAGICIGSISMLRFLDQNRDISPEEFLGVTPPWFVALFDWYSR